MPTTSGTAAPSVALVRRASESSPASSTPASTSATPPSPIPARSMATSTPTRAAASMAYARVQPCLPPARAATTSSSAFFPFPAPGSHVTTARGPTRISGRAPHANVISYKACQASNFNPGGVINLGTCPLDALVAAIDAATADVVDVINFSIGGGSTDPWSGPLQQAFFGTQAAGVFVAASAGNSGPNPQTIGQPSNAPWLMSVGASTHNRRPTVTLDASKANGAPIHLEGMAVAAGVGPVGLVDAKALVNELCNPFDATQAAATAGRVV